MDALVEKITREVLEAMGGPRGPVSPVPVSEAPVAVAKPAGGGRDLLLFVGDEDELKALVREVGALGVTPAQSYLVLPRDSSVRRSEADALGFWRIVFMDEGQRPVELVGDCCRVVVAVHRFQQLADLAGLCDSCWDVRLVIKALAQGRPVVLHLGPLQAAENFRRKVDDYVAEIASYGVQVVGARVATVSAPAPSRENPTVGDSGTRVPSVAAPLRSFLESHGTSRGGGRGNAPEPPADVKSSAGVGTCSGGRCSGSGCSSSQGTCLATARGECCGSGGCARYTPERVGIIVQQGADRISSPAGVGPVGPDLAKYIDHTILKPDATREEIVKLCQEAREYLFASVCVNPGFVHLAADSLKGSGVKVCTVVGFPLGATTTVAKAMETRDAVANGADEIDMVINVGALKARNDDLVRRDMEAVVEAADGRIVKVILETALLNDEEKVRACQLAREAGVDFVKTSTGFGPGGATAHDVGLMRQTVGRYMGVKASGGIRDFAAAQEMIKAGATRIGASASVKIVKGEVLPKSTGSASAKQPY